MSDVKNIFTQLFDLKNKLIQLQLHLNTSTNLTTQYHVIRSVQRFRQGTCWYGLILLLSVAQYITTYVLIRSRYLYLTYRSIYLDLIADDFDSKYTLKIKSAGPSNAVSVDLFFSSGYDFYTLICFD